MTDRLARLWADYGAPLKLTIGTRLALFWVAWVGMVTLRFRVNSVADRVPQNQFLNGWLNWDGGWYHRIAANGYTNVPVVGTQVDVVFLPGYPMLVRAGSFLTGGDLYLSAVLVSNLCLVVAICLLYRWVVETKGPEVAQHTITLLLCYPYAFFFSAMYTESLFLLETVAAIYAAHRQRWFLAGLCLAAASATRTIGLMAMVPVGLMYLQSKQWRLRAIRPDVLFIALGLGGLGGYMLFLHLRFGDALAFTRAFSAAGWSGDVTLERTLTHLLSPLRATWPQWKQGDFVLMDSLALWSLVVASGVTLLGARRLGIPNLLWTVIVLVIYWRAWFSAGRYLAVQFPLFLLVAEWTQSRPALYRFLVFGGTVLLATLLLLFAHGEWVA